MYGECIHVCLYVCGSLCAYICVYVWVCVSGCVCLHVCLHTCVHACASTPACVCEFRCICVYLFICTHTCTCVYMWAHVSVCMCDYAHTVGWNHRSNFSTSLMGNFCLFLKKSPLCLLLCVWGWPGTHYGAKTALNGLSVSWVPGLQACAVILAKNSIFERRKTSAFRQKEVSLGGMTSGDRRYCVVLELPLWGSGLPN